MILKEANSMETIPVKETGKQEETTDLWQLT